MPVKSDGRQPLRFVWDAVLEGADLTGYALPISVDQGTCQMRS